MCEALVHVTLVEQESGTTRSAFLIFALAVVCNVLLCTLMNEFDVSSR